jgi:hypothetical protein
MACQNPPYRPYKRPRTVIELPNVSRDHRRTLIWSMPEADLRLKRSKEPTAA